MILASRTFDLACEAATQELGGWLAGRARPGDVIALSGDLGCGKSTLARAFIHARTRCDEEVPSPTFTLVQTYDSAPCPIWHFDLYRLERPEDAFELGLDDAFMDICLIEWPERLGNLLPKNRLEVMLEMSPNPHGRKVTLTPSGHWIDDLELLP